MPPSQRIMPGKRNRLLGEEGQHEDESRFKFQEYFTAMVMAAVKFQGLILSCSPDCTFQVWTRHHLGNHGGSHGIDTVAVSFDGGNC